jgi:hypothetical protein
MSSARKEEFNRADVAHARKRRDDAYEELERARQTGDPAKIKQAEEVVCRRERALETAKFFPYYPQGSHD